MTTTSPPRPESRPLRVGIAGAGIMGADHLRTLTRSVRDAQVTVVADPDTARAAAAVAAAGAGDDVLVLADPLDLARSGACDAVVVASPDATHVAVAGAALAAGKPVLCEKPLAPTLAEAEPLVAAALAPGAPLFVTGFMRRFDPGYAAVRDAVASGRLGRARLAHHVSRGVSSGPGATSASSLTGSAIHDFDVVPWLLGAPAVEVAWYAPAAVADLPFADPQVMLLRTADGALSTLETFLDARYGYDNRCEVVGDRATTSTPVPARLSVDAELVHGTPHDADWRPRFADAYRLELQAWVDAARGGPVHPDLATAADGLAAQRIADAAIRSMREGRPLAVEGAPR